MGQDQAAVEPQKQALLGTPAVAPQGAFSLNRDKQAARANYRDHHNRLASRECCVSVVADIAFVSFEGYD